MNGCKGDIRTEPVKNNLVIYVTNNEARDSMKDEDTHTLFTEYLMKNIMRPELEVHELFDLTKYLVTMSSEGRQVPAPVVSPKVIDGVYLGKTRQGRKENFPSLPTNPGNLKFVRSAAVTGKSR